MTMYLPDDMTEDELYDAMCEQRAVTDDEKHSIRALAAMLADALSEARKDRGVNHDAISDTPYMPWWAR